MIIVFYDLLCVHICVLARIYVQYGHAGTVRPDGSKAASVWVLRTKPGFLQQAANALQVISPVSKLLFLIQVVLTEEMPRGLPLKRG